MKNYYSYFIDYISFFNLHLILGFLLYFFILKKGLFKRMKIDFDLETFASL